MANKPVNVITLICLFIRFVEKYRLFVYNYVPILYRRKKMKKGCIGIKKNDYLFATFLQGSYMA